MTDDPDRTALRRVLHRMEVIYGLSGWHGDEHVGPWLCSLHWTAPHRLTYLPMVPSDSLAWRIRPPAAVVDGFADEVADHPHLVQSSTRSGDPPLAGVAIAYEAWVMEADMRDDNAVSTLRQLSQQRRLNTHPQRQTARQVNGVLLTQERMSLVRYQRRPHDLVVMPDEARDIGTLSKALVRLASVLDDLVSAA